MAMRSRRPACSTARVCADRPMIQRHPPPPPPPDASARTVHPTPFTAPTARPRHRRPRKRLCRPAFGPMAMRPPISAVGRREGAAQGLVKLWRRGLPGSGPPPTPSSEHAAAMPLPGRVPLRHPGCDCSSRQWPGGTPLLWRPGSEDTVPLWVSTKTRSQCLIPPRCSLRVCPHGVVWPHRNGKQ
jgi:hypothetical protein